MPGRDRIIDPVTRDYVKDGLGGRKTSRDGRTALYHQLTGELNGWWGDADAGSDLFTLERGKLNDATLARAADIVRVAGRPLVEAGIIDDVKVTVERDEAGRLVVVSQQRSVQNSTEPASGILAIVG